MLKSPPAAELLQRQLLLGQRAEVQVRSMNRLDDSAQKAALRKLRADETRERAERAALTTAREEASEREARAERHVALAANVDRHNRLDRREATVRQLVRRDTEELRQLEEKLRAAYVGQGIRAQLAEREAQRLQEKLEDQQHLQQMLAQRQRDGDFFAAQRRADRDKKLHFRNGLLDQMGVKQRQRARLYEEFLLEKREVDRIVRQFYEETERQVHEDRERKLRFRDDLLAIRAQQEAWSRREREELAAEDERIAAFLVERQAREDEKRAADAGRLRGCMDLAERMGGELVEAEKKRQERAELLNMLKLEELEEQAAQRAREELGRRLRQRLAARTEFLRQRADRAQRAQQEQLDEREFRRQQLELLAERDRLEQMGNERRRQRIADHQRVVMRMLEQRREQRVADLADLVRAEREGDADRERLKQIVEEERIKILQEHAVALGGQFPRGVLRECDRAKLNI